MLIILEGPDLAGKTTLARRLEMYLSAKYGDHTIRVLHRGPPIQHPLDEYVTPLIHYRPGNRKHVICDRWHVGEVVYSGILNRATKMTPAVYRYVEAFLKARGAVVVHVNSDVATLNTRYDERGDDRQSLDTIIHASGVYRGFMNVGVKLTKVESNLVDVIVGAARHAENLALPYGRLKTYVGAHLPRRLYVGDVRNRVETVDPDWPAFGPYPATSGEYLMRAFAAGDDHWGLVNVNDVDQIEWLIAGMPFSEPSVIALGRNAQRTLTRMKVEHTAVPHPQFVRRFHHRALDEYAELLQECDGKDHIESWR